MANIVTAVLEKQHIQVNIHAAQSMIWITTDACKGHLCPESGEQVPAALFIIIMGTEHDTAFDT